MKLHKLGLALIATLSFYTSAETLKYSSQGYLDQQYEMLKLTFENLTVKKTDGGKAVLINIPSSYGFKTGKHTLKRPMKDTLAEMAHFLSTYPETTLEVIGHTDNVGSESSNIALGERRANAVSKELINAKVSPYRIITRSEGEEVPLCSNASASGRECNRRVEILVALERELEW